MLVGANAVAKDKETTWVYEDAANPWAGHAVAQSDNLDTVRAFVDDVTAIFNSPDDISLETLLEMETALLEHFHALLDLPLENIDADELLDLHTALQDILDLIKDERRYIKAHPTAPLSDAFRALHDKLLRVGYDITHFDTWVEAASNEAAPEVAYATIAQYLLLEPNAAGKPLTSLSEVQVYWSKAPSLAGAQVWQALVDLALGTGSPSAAEATIRAHAADDFLARMVLADRLWTRAWAVDPAIPTLSDTALCDHVVGLYYSSAEESIHALGDVEPELVDANVRLSYALMHPSHGRDLFGEVPEDGAEALDYYQSLAQGGDEYLSAEAAHRLGEMHFFGDAPAGIAADAAAARPFFERAAANGIPHALANLGLMHAHGLGVPRNASAARDYFEQAADLGFAQHGLGVLYWTGDPAVPRNVTRAVAHFEAAVALEYFEAHHYLGAAHLDGVGVPRNVTRAFEHFEAASRLAKSRQALFNVGVLYYQGTGTNASCPAALRHFREVAFLKEVPGFSVAHAVASFNAGDTVRSLLEHLLLSQLGIVDAQVNAAFLLEQPPTPATAWLQPSRAAAHRWYAHAAGAEDGEALRKLGQCHEDGWDGLCSRNASAALELYAAAGAAGDAEAYYHAGQLHWATTSWQQAHEAFVKCRAFGFPRHAPCLVPASVLDVYAMLHDLLDWWTGSQTD
ncbi:hypothetical protein ACHHYP_05860 [Achlya hypogyna]|nr:hypothetical protein ACHHYP_05860 [Achlya hypogyna]